MTQRECGECLKDFNYKGGSLKCSEECQLYYIERRTCSYNILRSFIRRLNKEFKRGEITEEEKKRRYLDLWNDRDAYLKDKTHNEGIEWRGNANYPEDEEE
jgi:hypothetical protein